MAGSEAPTKFKSLMRTALKGTVAAGVALGAVRGKPVTAGAAGLLHCEQAMKLERLNRITVEQDKCGGRPCIRGFRIRVTDVLELLGAGASIEEILADYPFLEREDVLAAIEYAAHQADHPVLQVS